MCAEGPWFKSGWKHIFYLHSNSAAKKEQNQIYPGRISHVHQKCVLKVQNQISQEEYYMYIKNASSFFLCSKKSTKSNLPRMNITCTSKKRLHFSSAAKKVQNQIWVGRISHVHQKCVLTLTLCVHQECVRFFRKRCCARYGRRSAGHLAGTARWDNKCPCFQIWEYVLSRFYTPAFKLPETEPFFCLFLIHFKTKHYFNYETVLRQKKLLRPLQCIFFCFQWGCLL